MRGYMNESEWSGICSGGGAGLQTPLGTCCVCSLREADGPTGPKEPLCSWELPCVLWDQVVSSSFPSASWRPDGPPPTVATAARSAAGKAHVPGLLAHDCATNSEPSSGERCPTPAPTQPGCEIQSPRDLRLGSGCEAFMVSLTGEETQTQRSGEGPAHSEQDRVCCCPRATTRSATPPPAPVLPVTLYPKSSSDASASKCGTQLPRSGEAFAPGLSLPTSVILGV